METAAGDGEPVRPDQAAARKKLPVIEVAIIAVAAMYGMYLLATGVKKEETEDDEPRGIHRFHGERIAVLGTPGQAIGAAELKDRLE